MFNEGIHKTMNENPEQFPIVVGLDIGTTKIAAFAGYRNEHGKIEILGMGRTDSFGVLRGMVSNIELTVQAIKKALAQVDTNADLEIKEVVVGIAGQHIKSLHHRDMVTRSNTDNEISEDDVRQLTENIYRITMNPGEEVIHVIPQEYIIDNEPGIKNPVGHTGIRLEGNFHIITGQVSPIKNIYKCVTKAGYEVKGLYLEPIASAEAVLFPEEKEAGVALVDIGGGTTDIAIFYDGVIRHTAVIPFGGNIITEDIKEAFKLIHAQAEKLKVKFGSALPTETARNQKVTISGIAGRPSKEVSCYTLAQVIEARMKEILEFVEYEIKTSGFEKKLSQGIVVTGGGSMLMNLSKLISYQLGLECRLGNPHIHLAGNQNELKNPMYATGIGLVMKGLEDEEKRLSEYLKKQKLEQVQLKKEAEAKSQTRKKTIIDFFSNLKTKVEGWIEDDLD
ncbi:MAG: cell division protein FtsA [Bacteroidia bacterium]|nr:cell division protein FtsA [Bacteroidia bacterium]